MKMMNTLIGMAAGAAIGMAAGYAAREMGGVSTRQVKNQAKRAVRAMEQAADRLSWRPITAEEIAHAAVVMTAGLDALGAAIDSLSYPAADGR